MYLVRSTVFCSVCLIRVSEKMWFSYVAITVIVGLVLLTFDSTTGLFSSSQPLSEAAC